MHESSLLHSVFFPPPKPPSKLAADRCEDFNYFPFTLSSCHFSVFIPARSFFVFRPSCPHPRPWKRRDWGSLHLHSIAES